MRGAFYATPDRLTQRTSALHAAKISDGDATVTITDLAAQVAPPGPVVADIGCGRGTTTLGLARRLAPAQLIALDQSPALLSTVRQRLTEAGHPLGIVCADFHHLPWAQASIDVAVAAFCLYHSPHPERVVAEIARCLKPGGAAVLATKSADSYHEIDQLIAEAGLDPDATTRPSLYTTFHSGTITEITATALRVDQLRHQRHVFCFGDFDHLAAYLATSPKYALPDDLTDNPDRLAAHLRRAIPERPITATSTVTYALAARP